MLPDGLVLVLAHGHIPRPVAQLAPVIVEHGVLVEDLVIVHRSFFTPNNPVRVICAK
jgi:hypothetical protein